MVSKVHLELADISMYIIYVNIDHIDIYRLYMYTYAYEKDI